MKTRDFARWRMVAWAPVVGLTTGMSACTSILGDLPPATVEQDASTQDAGGDAGGDGTMPYDSSASAEAMAPDVQTGDDGGPGMDSGHGDATVDAGADSGPSCVNACVAGTAQCATDDGGTAAQKCEAQSNGCTGWVVSQACSSVQSCSAADAGAACACQATECTVAGPVCQSATTLATCTQDGTSGCLYVSATSTCGAPQSCSGQAGSAACATQCTDSCPSAGAETCVNGGVATCAQQSNGCLAWGTPVACASNQTCTVSGSSATCVCNNPAACDGVAGATCTQGTGYVDCTTDTNGCLVAATKSCASNQTCGGSAGSASCSCVNPSSCQGATGETCTSSSEYVTCTKDSNGCLVASNPVACSTNETCGGSTPGSEACSCPSSYTLCGGSCTATGSDANNCGTCGHACGTGSTCEVGYCTPQTVCSGFGTGSPMWAVGTTALLPGGGVVFTCNLSTTGGTPAEIFHSTGVSLFSVSGTATTAYLPGRLSSGARSLYTSNGTAVSLLTGLPSSLDTAYVTATTDSTTGAFFVAVASEVYIVEVSEVDAGFPTQVCMVGLQNTTAIAAAGGQLIAADGTSNEIIGNAVTNAQTCPGTNSIIAKGLSSPSVVATNGTVAAFADANGIYSCNTAIGCVPSTPSPLVTGQGTIAGIVLDQAAPPNLYWIGSAGLATCSSDPTVCKNQPHILAPNATSTPGLLVDSTYVYYTQGSILYKVAK